MPKPNNFTLNNGVIVSDNYARTRIIARLRRYGVSLENRRAVADYMISSKSGKRGYTVSALERSALYVWIYDKHFYDKHKESELCQ